MGRKHNIAWTFAKGARKESTYLKHTFKTLRVNSMEACIINKSILMIIDIFVGVEAYQFVILYTCKVAKIFIRFLLIFTNNTTKLLYIL